MARMFRAARLHRQKPARLFPIAALGENEGRNDSRWRTQKERIALLISFFQNFVPRAEALEKR